MDVRGRLRELMKQREWSEYELSRRSGVPQSTINSMFRKNNLPSIPTLESLCGAFGISLSGFFAEREDAPALSPELSRLLETWTGLSPEQREALLHLMQTM